MRAEAIQRMKTEQCMYDIQKQQIFLVNLLKFKAYFTEQ